MKNLLFTFAILFTAFTFSLAQRTGRMASVLRLRMADGALITVEIDGRRYERVSDRLIIGDLPSGRHSIRVYRVSNNGGSRRIPARLVWEDRIKLAASTVTSITIDGSGNSARVRTRPLEENYAANDNNRNREENDRDRDEYTDNPRDHQDENYVDGDRVSGTRNAFSTRDMEELQRQVAGRMMDGDKLSGIKTAVGDRTLTTAQVRTMMGWLTFESTKVDLAKWGYNRVTDSRDYWKLESEFTFQSSKDELQQVIRSGSGGARGRD